MKIAIYNLYWSTMAVANKLRPPLLNTSAVDGHDVTLLGPEPIDVETTRQRLGRDLLTVWLPTGDRRC